MHSTRQHRKEDQVETYPPITLSYGRVIQKPDLRQSAAFYRALVAKFKEANADRIMGYIMTKINEILTNTDKHSGYSEAKVLWDREKDNGE